MKSKILKHGGLRTGDYPGAGKASMISIKIPKSMLVLLDEKAKKNGITRSEYIRQVLNKGIK
tara:strand:+ start:3030 stop:3215 length:186 start_codon:yes stop_codon:yes gene_type:complete